MARSTLTIGCTADAAMSSTPTTLTRILVGDVSASPDQNRETFDPVELQSLADSIGELGLLQPITVRRECDLAGERYILVAGERRLRACKLLGWGDIPAIVSDEPLDETAALRTLAENMVRVDPGPLEEARGLAQARERYGLEGNDLARRLGKNPRWVRDRLALLALADDVAHWVQVGTLPIGRAVLISDLDVNRQRLAVQAHERGLGIDAYRALVARLHDEQSADAMFDTDSFLAVEEYVMDAERAVESPVSPETVREAPLGRSEIASLLGVKLSTVAQWKSRDLLPAPDLEVSGSPLWWRQTVIEWATETGRL